MLHECEARYPKLDPAYVADSRYWPRPTLVANLLHLLGITDV